MRQEEAKRHLFSGGFLVILDAPKAGFTFSIDLHTWTTGPIFRGIKMVPPGIHLFSVSLGDTAPKQSFWRDFKAGQVVAFQYNDQAEEIRELPEQARRTVEGSILEMDPYMAPYPMESLKPWESLSNRISMDTLSQVIPSLSFDPMTSSYLGAILDNKDEVKSTASESFGFTEIDLKRSFPDSSVGRERTLLSLDKSYLLESITETVSEEHWLGEFQLAFLIIILGHNFEGFEQWKRMLELVSKSKQAIERRPLFFQRVLVTMTAQLANCPADFFADLFDASCIVAVYFRDLYAGCTGRRDLVPAAESFAAQVNSSFGWALHEELEPDDEQPVIVDL